jgi:quinoprotein glucose dehydrogenase
VRIARRVYISLLFLIGLMMFAGGARLLTLGGSPYYVLCGAAVSVSAFGLSRDFGWGAVLYGLAVCATVSWAIWEVGFDTWLLLPRVGLVTVLGLFLLLPSFRRRLTWSRSPSIATLVGVPVLVILAGVLLRSAWGPVDGADPMYRGGGSAIAPDAIALIGQGTQAQVHDPAVDQASADWSEYGKDAGGTRYSTLDQITPDGVPRLQLAWKYETASGLAREATPLKIDQSLYFCSGHGVTALDAETGARIWQYDVPGSSPGMTCRGVAYYRSPAPSGRCAGRIISTATTTQPFDVKLFAVDARDGQRCEGFGVKGEVSLLTGLGKVPDGYYYVSSAPTIIHNKIVVGAGIPDFQYWGEPSGVVRAFDANSGKLAWAWDMGQSEQSALPGPGQAYTLATPNSWGPMSADEQLGLIFIPTGNATPDFFGGNRRSFDEQYSSSVVALDEETGKPRWSFQTTHHDLWDYDVASQPTLIDLHIASHVVRALVQPTKKGDIFVLNRETGAPIFPVEEQPAPREGGAAGDRPAVSQPVSVGMPSFRGPDLSERRMWGVTPIDQLWCRVRFREARYDGTYTLPGVSNSVEMPSYFGGINWGGIAVDPQRGIGIVTSSYVPVRVRLLSRSESARLGITRVPATAQLHWGVPINLELLLDAINPLSQNADLGFLSNPHWRYAGPGDGTPYGTLTSAFLSPLQIPCNEPPFGRLSAVNLRTGRLIWSQPFGTTRDTGPFGLASHLALPLGVPNTSGAMVTQSGVTFIGSTQEQTLRGYETATGRLLWEERLPFMGDATPMTYRSSVSKRQFVVIVAGGAQVLAFALH